MGSSMIGLRVLLLIIFRSAPRDDDLAVLLCHGLFRLVHA